MRRSEVFIARRQERDNTRAAEESLTGMERSRKPSK
jgi:hypothetical protein